jgi:Flp pilus assembly protein TadG
LVPAARGFKNSAGTRLNDTMFLIERFRKVRARMRADGEKGSAAIEFAFVAPVFFVLLMGTFEAAIMFFSQAALQNGMSDMGRYIRTGQVNCHTKSNGNCIAMTKEQFRTMLCDKISPLIACDSNLQIDVKSFPNYGSVPITTKPLKADNTLDPTFNRYETGNACEVVLARAFYTWPVATPVLTWFLVNMAGDKHLVTAATAFRNEPYNSAAAGC